MKRTCATCRQALPKARGARADAAARTLSLGDLDAIQNVLAEHPHRVSARGIIALGLLYEDLLYADGGYPPSTRKKRK